MGMAAAVTLGARGATRAAVAKVAVARAEVAMAAVEEEEGEKLEAAGTREEVGLRPSRDFGR